MNLPIQSQPVLRNVSTAKMAVSNGVNPSIDFKCLVKCAGSLAKCIGSSDPVKCLISAGASDCISCL
ncbi:hypothetical protein [Okeania sp. KiyG1]|uniref:hypothetical protein n=1 Tax=Okeania sp. KiyG1 TaxID=2720165 RepID=UPI0019226B45|nr:hypothetical protein [Okeania sp. KiyG1]GGA18692.1 hypothetical protein CYANOKiyG1_33190 [Okeania sp. KiyG1]